MRRDIHLQFLLPVKAIREFSETVNSPKGGYIEVFHWESLRKSIKHLDLFKLDLCHIMHIFLFSSLSISTSATSNISFFPNPKMIFSRIRLDWISLGGVRCRAPYGSEKKGKAVIEKLMIFFLIFRMVFVGWSLFLPDILGPVEYPGPAKLVKETPSL